MTLTKQELEELFEQADYDRMRDRLLQVYKGALGYGVLKLDENLDRIQRRDAIKMRLKDHRDYKLLARAAEYACFYMPQTQRRGMLVEVESQTEMMEMAAPILKRALIIWNFNRQ